MHRDQQGYPGPGAARLAGRRDELSVLGGLIDAVREGESRVLVVRGEPGGGKTTLLEHVVGRGVGGGGGVRGVASALRADAGPPRAAAAAAAGRHADRVRPRRGAAAG